MMASNAPLRVEIVTVVGQLNNGTIGCCFAIKIGKLSVHKARLLLDWYDSIIMVQTAFVVVRGSKVILYTILYIYAV